MKTVLVTIGAIAAVVVALIAWRLYATIAGGRRAYRRLLEEIAPVTRALAGGRDPDARDLARFAEDRATRKVLHDVLVQAGKVHLLPGERRTWEAMAEADLTAWLNHPNELGAAPDEMELTATRPAPDGKGHYFVFRYRMRSPHWAADDGWMAGIAGPYDLREEPVPHGRGTFSRFEPFDSRTPEGHVEVTHRAIVERKS